MSATPYEPTMPTTRTEYADVLAVAGGLVDLDFGSDADPVTGVGCYGALPSVGQRVLVLLQGNGATVLPPGVGLAVPRWRGLMAARAQPTGGTEATWTGTATVFGSHRITYSNGTFTFPDDGIYAIGGRFTVNGAGATGEQRILLSWWRGTIPYRIGLPRKETYGSFSFVDAMNGGQACDFRVFQDTGVTVTYSEMRVNIAKIGDL